MAAMFNVVEVARILNLTPEAVRDLIAARQIRAVDVSRSQAKARWRIPPESLEQFIRSRATVQDLVPA